MMTLPSTEIGGLSPAELKFGTRDHSRFQQPPGHTYGDLVFALDRNLAIVRSITPAYQDSLRQHRQSHSPPDSHNRFQPGDFVLWNPLETPHSFRCSKLSPKLLGPYVVIEQIKNDITCQHVVTNIVSRLHASRVTPYFGTPDTAYTTVSHSPSGPRRVHNYCIVNYWYEIRSFALYESCNCVPEKL
jgi:hypothetical protein